MEIGVGVELARDQVVQLPGARGKDKGQAVDDGVDQARGRNGGVAVDVIYAGDGEVLAQYECEVEGKLFVVGQAQEEGRGAVAGRR